MKDTYGQNSFNYHLARYRYADILYWKGNHEAGLKIYEDLLLYFSKNINKEHLRIAHIFIK